LDDDIKNAIHMKKAVNPLSTTSATIITDVNTVAVPTTGPITRSKTLQQPLIPNDPPVSEPFNWQSEEQLRGDMIQTVRDFQELPQPDAISQDLDTTTLAEDTCNNIIAQVESQTI